MCGIGLPELLVLAFLGLVIIYPLWRICTKMGYSGWLSLTQLVPVLNLIILIYLAFSEWPIHKELRELQSRTNPPAA